MFQPKKQPGEDSSSSSNNWAIFIDYFTAIVLVIAAVASAELPSNNRGFLAQEPPYAARGFRPAGPAFNLPQRQQQPPTAYGPPSATTTEVPTTTETIETTTILEPQVESFRVTPDVDQTQQQQNPGAFYVVVPQNQLYASAKLVQQQPRLVPLQAVPAFAKIQEVPTFAKIQEVPTFAKIQQVPTFAKIQEVPQFAQLNYNYNVPLVASSAYTSFVSTPYSSSYIQSFQ
ncbi:unnamed protein product [Ceutorhynchus assimilis]|uniref:Uncharacterized protein n=1 Tax=Ceutorhynchus assimilis TaxID=467358 RepID=A0A9N9MM25_9CUCU|nr:unnamed protein product [Ceutorhynchus assimilis]